MKQGAKLTSQMNNRRELNPDQRRAKNEGDRRRRREHTVEFQRLQMAEAELQALLETQRSENRNLREKNERLNAMLSNLMNMIHQLREERRQQRETMEMVDSWIQFDRVPSPNEDGASNEATTRGN
ncbi:uncharacterized protein LOC110428478 isoform X2 [Herrania umbratica]|uniref:Uncharacterized protein LOC110428478 isoform X2 n=1 Tax=Herrania umbratica TaxID=108875 RepID=A0A6J1BNX8_9ROSI|nr:uncharacterized protein LOC110428478 isoform X2 [Herrania umbratica]